MSLFWILQTVEIVQVVAPFKRYKIHLQRMMLALILKPYSWEPRGNKEAEEMPEIKKQIISRRVTKLAQKCTLTKTWRLKTINLKPGHRRSSTIQGKL